MRFSPPRLPSSETNAAKGLKQYVYYEIIFGSRMENQTGAHVQTKLYSLMRIRTVGWGECVLSISIVCLITQA